MFLKTLQIKGFKSFADQATLDLEPGVTVVVGPNGSGKSNVVDAIGWVLGAQAPSAVRSQKMDDVIFAGSARRPALGRAEVSLTIDNSSGMLPIDFTEVTISRVLFRSGESEYLMNGVECRLHDIQELLSDSGVGRQQHVIISQGQIDAVLNAKPGERRLIIEEAAGILKFRKRKEKAERRLAATDANLLRIKDTLTEVRRQLKPLERQADAARRHGAVVAELAALRRFLTGRDLARLRRALADSQAEQAGLRAEERRLQSALAALDTRVLEVEARLSATGGHDLSDALVRYESLRERAIGLGALLEERGRGALRDLDAFVDQAVVASLESERARCDEELSLLETARAELAAAEEELAAMESPDGMSPGGAAAIRAELRSLRSAGNELSADHQRRTAHRERLEARLRELLAEEAGHRAQAEALAGELPGLVAELDRCRESHDRAVVHCEEAERELAQADANRHDRVARLDVLAQSLDEARARAGADRLAGVEGVVGSLLDGIEVDPDWSDAVEAAVADALSSVVVEDLPAARRALAVLAAEGMSGSVITAGDPGPTSPPIPGGEPVRRHVRGIRPGVDAVLDQLLAGAVAVEGGWESALEVWLRFPDRVVVTREGDRFSANGCRLGAATSGATGAALERARELAAEATTRSERAAARLEDARRKVAESAASLSEIRERHQKVVSDLERLSAAADFASRSGQQVREESAEVAAQLDSLEQRRAAIATRLAELEAQLPAAEAAEAAAADVQARFDRQRQQVTSMAAELATRERNVARRIDELETRLARHAQDRLVARRRREELEARHHAYRRLGTIVGARLDRIDEVLERLREARRVQSERTRHITAELEAIRRERGAQERELHAVRERLQRCGLADAETKVRLESVVETCRAELDIEPDAAIATECPPLPDGTTPAGRVRELERDLRLMGPINPLALEEFQALGEREAFLVGQLEDIRTTRRELARVIRAVDDEIVSIFAAAYADVATNFTALFQTLFPGGSGALQLTDPHNLLETGIEIEAKPSGKNVKKLSLLSGGERSLTALAYLFAVFRSRPSPFYVMDEVEAALDDVNLHRFLGLVAEFRTTAQLLIVSHQKRTMEAADVLYGVTMEQGGSSKVISERVGALVD